MAGYIGPDPSQLKDTQNRNGVTAADGQTVFSASYTPNYIDVFQNGLKLDPAIDFTAVNGTSFTLTVPAVLGDSVSYVAVKSSNPWDFYTKAQADQKMGFYGVATGTGDGMTVALSPTPTSLTDGMEIKIRVPAGNITTTPSLTIQGLGVSKTIYKFGGQAIQPGEWGTNQEITLRYTIAGDKLELITGGMGINVKTLVDAANISWDLNQGVMAILTLGGNRIFNNPTNLKPGTYILILKQDGVGTRTITSWGNLFKWVNGIAPGLSTSVNSTDILSFVCDGTYLYGAINNAFA